MMATLDSRSRVHSFQHFLQSLTLQGTPKKRHRRSNREDPLTEMTVALMGAQAKQLAEHGGTARAAQELEISKLAVENRRLDLEEKRLKLQEHASKQDVEDRNANRAFQTTMLTALVDLMKRDRSQPQ